MKPMRTNRIRVAAAVVLSIFALSTVVFGAGGAPNTDPGGGIGGTGISSFGVVQRFGSIFVNGREYILEPGTRVIRGLTTTNTTALRLGQVVAVRGHIEKNNGRSVADRVVIRIVLQGHIETLNTADGSFTMLGQTVRMPVSRAGKAAAGDMPGLPNLKLGEAVGVSGLRLADGAWDATYVSPTGEADANQFVVHGKAIGVDRANGKIRIGTMSFRVSPNMLTDVVSGEQVVVAGRYINGIPATTSVLPDKPHLGKAGTAVEMSGYLQGQQSPGLLTTNGVTLRVPSGAKVTGGAMAELKPGSAIAVRGSLRPDGSVTVSELMLNIDPTTVKILPPGGAITSQPKDGGDPNREMENGDETKNSNERDQRPSIDRPEIERPEVEAPEIERPDISAPEMDH